MASQTALFALLLAAVVGATAGSFYPIPVRALHASQEYSSANATVGIALGAEALQTLLQSTLSPAIVKVISICLPSYIRSRVQATVLETHMKIQLSKPTTCTTYVPQDMANI